MAEIGQAQKKESNLRRQGAARHFYKVAKRWHLTGSSVALLLALVSPVVFFLMPSIGPLLGAVAGAWVFVSRLLVCPARDRCRQKGAIAQEMFDCEVLGLPWNDSLAARLSEEEIHSASRGARSLDAVRDWYPADIDASWPLSVLICQRSNAVWARRQHDLYGCLLLSVATAWFVLGVVLALVDGATLAAYLTTLALPSLPAFLDAAELGQSHRRAASHRTKQERLIDSLCEKLPGDVVPMREVQDGLFRLRREDPLIPEWFYAVLSSSFESDMEYGALATAERHHDGKDR